MKVIPFKIPKQSGEGFKIQVDEMPRLYPQLHQHPEIQLTYIKKSSGVLMAGDYIGRFTKEDVYIIGSNQPHVFRNDSVNNKKEKAYAISIFFNEATLGESFWQLPELKQGLQFFEQCAGGFKVTGAKQKLVTGKMELLIIAKGFEKIILFIEIIKLLSQKKDMQPLCQDYLYPAIKNPDGSRLSNVIEYIFKNQHRSISLKEIAAVANMVPEAFCKYFKMRTRKTYTTFLNEIRISNAVTMLLQQDKTVATVCYQSGFNNLSNFNRVFKKVTCKTPVEYLKDTRPGWME